MARRTKEPWELEEQPGGGGSSSASSSASTANSTSGGGLKVPSSGSNSHNPSPTGVTVSQTPVAAAENSTTQYSSDRVQQSTQTHLSAKATSGNSAGHMATIKTNYTKGADAGSKAAAGAGYGNSHGRTTATKAAASGSYQNRDSSLSREQRETKVAAEKERGEKLSNTYDSDGERMTKSEFRAYQNELKNSDIQGMRRIMISPDPALGITEQEMVSITRDTMWAWAETSGKQFGFSFAVHDGQSVIHSHVCMYSENENDINMASKQLETFKGLVDQAINDQLDMREELGQEIKLEQNMDEIQEQRGGEDDQQLNQIDNCNSDDLTAGRDDVAEEAAEVDELEIAL